MRLASVLLSARHRLPWYGRVHRCCRQKLQSDQRPRCLLPLGLARELGDLRSRWSARCPATP